MSSNLRKENLKSLRGLEIFEIKPVILGGSPIDPKNKVFLNRQQHIEQFDTGTILLKITSVQVQDERTLVRCFPVNLEKFR